MFPRGGGRTYLLPEASRGGQLVKRFTCLTALFIALALFTPTSPLGSEEPEDVTLNGQVQECKKNGKGLSVLFLVDLLSHIVYPLVTGVFCLRLSKDGYSLDWSV